MAMMFTAHRHDELKAQDAVISKDSLLLSNLLNSQRSSYSHLKHIFRLYCYLQLGTIGASACTCFKMNYGPGIL